MMKATLQQQRVLPVIVFVAGALLAASTYGADRKGAYRLYGSRTCSEYLQAKQEGNPVGGVAVDGWVAGYISAYNSIAPDTFNIMGGSDLGGALLWLKNYCEKQPLSELGEAMQLLIKELQPKRKRQGD
jgi:hypothetical protein